MKRYFLYRESRYSNLADIQRTLNKNENCNNGYCDMARDKTASLVSEKDGEKKAALCKIDNYRLWIGV